MNLPLVKEVMAQVSEPTIVLEPAGALAELGGIKFGSIVNTAFQIILVVAAVAFFFILIIGGIRWITAGGDENKVKAAKTQITNALIGLVIVFAAWAIANLLATVFGINIFTKFDIPTISKQ